MLFTDAQRDWSSHVRVSLAADTAFSRLTIWMPIGCWYLFAPNFTAVLPSPVTS